MTTQKVVSDEMLGRFARRIRELQERVEKGVIHYGETMAGLQDLIEGLMARVQNPYVDQIVKPTWDYPHFWQMSGWEEQLGVLQEVYPCLNSEGLAEQAGHYLSQNELWTQPFRRELTGKKILLWDGLLVFPLPGKAAAKLGLGDLWKDLSLGREGRGIWGKLCEEVLFQHLSKKFSNFRNYQEGKMNSHQFLPLKEVAVWLESLEQTMPGDFACRPFNFGRRLAGHSILSSRWVAENELAGIVTPSWLNGQGFLTNAERLPQYGYLGSACAGDRCRFEGALEFQLAPHFYHNAFELGFYTLDVGLPYDNCGAGFVLR